MLHREKIVELGSDLLIVSQQCSRLALLKLITEEISLVTNVAVSTVERIARAIRAPVIGSIDHINQLDADTALGECSR